MNTNDIKNLLTLKETSDEVEVNLGWVTLARIVEEGGFWYLVGNGNNMPTSTNGFETKEAAFEQVVEWFKSSN